MQANYIAQFQRADAQSATNRFGFAQTQSSKDLVGATFAEMFAQMRSGNNDFGYGNTRWDDVGWQTNQYAGTQNSSEAVQQNDTRENSREVSSSGKEVERPTETDSSDRYEDVRAAGEGDRTEITSQDDQGAVDGDKTTIAESEANQTQSDMSGHDDVMEGNTPAVLAALAEYLLKQAGNNDAGTEPKINLDESARKQLVSILQELNGKTGKEAAADALNKMKELLQKHPDAAAAAKGHLQNALAGQDKGATLSSLREWMSQMGLNPQGIEFKKTRAEGGHDGKSKAEFSLLESAASEHSRRRIKMDPAEQQAGTGKDTKQGTSGEAGRAGNQAEKAMNLATSENAGRIQRTQEGNSFHRTLTDVGDRMGSGVTTRQDVTAKGADKATKASANQETVIKNFQDVKALLDKQVLQVKETSVSTMTIKLNPEELGKIKIQLELLENGKLQGKIFVENEVTKNSLLQHADAMKEQIKAQGVSLEGFEIDMGSEYMDQDFKGFDQQRQFGRQPEKSRNGNYADTIYDEETSEQLRSVLQESAQQVGKLNILA